MKSFKAPTFWVMLIGLLSYAIVNSFVLVDQSYVYVQNDRVFHEFKLTVEYQSKLEKIRQQRALVLDSVETSIRQEQARLSKDSPAEELQAYQGKLMEYEALGKRFSEQNSSLSSQYDAIIWKQLDAYIKEYGKSKGYDIILGTNGTGNVMYADDALDATEELMEYINQKYDGH